LSTEVGERLWVTGVGVHRIHRGVEEGVHRDVDNIGETGRFLVGDGVVRSTG
jgi:hypothetical protein